ncbi:MAG: hypothetical protein EPN97_07860 [Alphaproteobacteria bacterium]|nr:MAG: hypothetical protein EPN97_07860 [Alphaproteobacteria bacterium]
MKNYLKPLKDKLSAVIARLKTPETQAKIMQRSGAGLLGGAAVAFGVIIFAPALAVPAGATCLALMGTGFGLLQESDNKKYASWMKEHAAAQAPAPVVPAPVVQPEPSAHAPVFELKLPGVEFAKVAEPKEAAVVAAPTAAPEAPKPPPATPKP